MKLLRIVGIATAVFVIAVGLVVLRLTAGPMSISFLDPLIQSNLAESFPGFTITYTRPSLAWSPDRNTVDLKVTDATISAVDGSLNITLPEERRRPAQWNADDQLECVQRAGCGDVW